MGNGLCCYGPDEVRDEPLIEQKALTSTNFETKDEEYSQIEDRRSSVNPNTVEKVVYGEQNTQNHHRQGSNQMPKHIDSCSEQDDASELDTEDKETEEKVESEMDGSSDDSISALEEPFVPNLTEEDVKEEDMGHCIKDEGSYQHQRRRSSQISQQLQTLKVLGAGDPAVNGVYRWFAAHGRFVMFTDHGQYQIMGGVNLSEYGDRYYDCWVIEEITENVDRLYAVPSSESAIPEGGWFCIDGSKPAPEVKGGEERDDYESDGYIDTEGSASSLSLMPNSYWAANGLDGIDGLEWVN